MKNIFAVLMVLSGFSLVAAADNYVPNTPIYQTNTLGSSNAAITPINNNAYNNQATYLPGVAYQPFVNVDLGWNQHTLESLKYSPLGMSLMPASSPQIQRASGYYYGRPAYRYGY